MYKLIYLFVLFFYTLTSSCDENIDYGYNIKNTPIIIGGYFNINYDEHDDHKLIFDDIALLFYANYNKVDILSEIEMSDIPIKDIKKSNLKIYIERLQLAYYIGENSEFTIGKFNSNIGFWNQAPINTLVDTTTKPHLLKSTFPKLTTGIIYKYSFNQEENILSITLQNNQNISKEYNNMIIKKHYHIGFTKYYDSSTFKVDGGYYQDIDSSDSSTYAGVGFENRSDNFTILSELFTKQTTSNPNTPYDGYLQTTWHVLDRHDLTIREELYKSQSKIDSISVLGYTFRPKPAITLKGEYIKHSRIKNDRFVFSYSMVF